MGVLTRRLTCVFMKMASVAKRPSRAVRIVSSDEESDKHIEKKVKREVVEVLDDEEDSDSSDELPIHQPNTTEKSLLEIGMILKPFQKDWDYYCKDKYQHNKPKHSEALLPKIQTILNTHDLGEVLIIVRAADGTTRTFDQSFLPPSIERLDQLVNGHPSNVVKAWFNERLTVWKPIVENIKLVSRHGAIYFINWG